MLRVERRRSLGSVMTEMVVVMPTILLVMCAIVQFSMLFSDGLQLNYASYRRARGAVVAGNDSVPTFSDEGWKNVMPNAKAVSGVDSVDRMIGNDSEYFDTLLVTSTVQYDSKLLIPSIFPSDTLESLTGSSNGPYYIQQRARGFSPAVVLSPQEESEWWSWWRNLW